MLKDEGRKIEKEWERFQEWKAKVLYVKLLEVERAQIFQDLDFEMSGCRVS